MENDYGSVFRSLILAHKPRLVIECGILDGYSTYHIAHALRFNRQKRGIKASFFAYDLFEDYEYNHGDHGKVCDLLRKYNLLKYCTIQHGDAFFYSKMYSDNSVDFLHMDISNDGNVLVKTLNTWGSKISENGIIAFEGGSYERDDGWIKKYNKKPIRDELINNPLVYENWDIQIFDVFPSLTLMWRKIKNNLTK